MASPSKFLFGVASGQPPDTLQAFGGTDTGYGPAPYIFPLGSSPAPEPVIEQTPEWCEITTYTDVHGTAWEDRATAELVNETAAAEKYAMPANGFKVINVVEHFPWSHSPETAMTGRMDDVPFISLMEHRILQNVSLNSMLYNLNTLTDLDRDLADKAVDYTKNQVDTGTDFLTKLIPGDGFMSQYAKSTTKEVGSRLSKAIESIKQLEVNTEKYPTSFQRPYHRLYSTNPTGFKYKFPYFTDDYKSVNPVFSDESGHTNMPFQKFLTKSTDFLGGVVNMLNTSSSGTYIESPKYPNFPQEGKQYTFQFPLMNTVSVEQTQKNWELIFMLLYQNTPNRVNRSVIAPPHIYEALIPGVWYSRYAYISRLDITMVGSRRTMPVQLHQSFSKLDNFPGESTDRPDGLESDGAAFSRVDPGGYFTCRPIIPDAFQVSITVSELIPESQNYMMEALRQGELIEVSDPVDSDTRGGQSIGKSPTDIGNVELANMSIADAEIAGKGLVKGGVFNKIPGG